jgi:hypothetical protein
MVTQSNVLRFISWVEQLSSTRQPIIERGENTKGKA